MKKVLLSTAALALAFAVSPAFAQEESGVKLELGGHFKGYGVYVDQDEVAGQDTRSADILRDTEVHFGGETTLDNGLTVGAHIEALADQGDSFGVDESYAYFSGSWGRVNFGSEDGAAFLLQVAAPSADSNYDGVRQFVQPFNVRSAFGASTTSDRLLSASGDGLDYDQDISGKSDKLTYLSPVFSGFQAGVSWTPEVRTSSRALDGIDTASGLSDVVDVAGRYSGEFDGFNVTAGAGYTNYEGDDAWNVGLDFDIGAFGLGAAYTTEDIADTNDQTDTIVVGADYTTGPFTLGVSYLNKDVDNVGEADRYTGGVVYSYGPGMTFRGSVSYVDVSQDGAGTLDPTGTAVMLGTQINF